MEARVEVHHRGVDADAAEPVGHELVSCALEQRFLHHAGIDERRNLLHHAAAVVRQWQRDCNQLATLAVAQVVGVEEADDGIGDAPRRDHQHGAAVARVGHERGTCGRR